MSFILSQRMKNVVWMKDKKYPFWTVFVRTGKGQHMQRIFSVPFEAVITLILKVT